MYISTIVVIIMLLGNINTLDSFSKCNNHELMMMNQKGQEECEERSDYDGLCSGIIKKQAYHSVIEYNATESLDLSQSHKSKSLFE